MHPILNVHHILNKKTRWKQGEKERHERCLTFELNLWLAEEQNTILLANKPNS